MTDKCDECGETPEILYQVEGKEFCFKHIPEKYQGYEDIPQRRVNLNEQKGETENVTNR